MSLREHAKIIINTALEAAMPDTAVRKALAEARLELINMNYQIQLLDGGSI